MTFWGVNYDLLGGILNIYVLIIYVFTFCWS